MICPGLAKEKVMEAAASEAATASPTASLRDPDPELFVVVTV